MSSKLIKSFEKYITLTDEEKEFLLSKVEIRKVKKKEFLQKEFEITKNTFFVLSGCLRFFFTDSKNVEHTASLITENTWVADAESYLFSTPSRFQIQAVMESEVAILPQAAKEELMEKYPKIERYNRIVLEQLLMNHRKRLIERHSLSAEERYKVFCETYPNLVKTVPQKQIASYLGITPEFFSAMKKKMKSK